MVKTKIGEEKMMNIFRKSKPAIHVEAISKYYSVTRSGPTTHILILFAPPGPTNLVSETQKLIALIVKEKGRFLPSVDCKVGTIMETSPSVTNFEKLNELMGQWLDREGGHHIYETYNQTGINVHVDRYSFAQTVWASPQVKIKAYNDSMNVPPELEPLLSKDWATRIRIISEVGNSRDTRAVTSLIEALYDRDRHIRLEAAIALGKIGDARAGESLMEAAKDSDLQVRRAAATSLGQIGDTRAIELLNIMVRQDSSTSVQEAAAQAIGLLSQRPSSLASGNEKKKEEPTVTVPNEWGVGDGKAFILPRYPNVVEVFARTPNSERYTLPYAYLNHPEATVRLATIAELRKMGGSYLSNQVLIDRLADSSPEVCNAAAQAIWTQHEAVQNALRSLRDEIQRSGFKSTLSAQQARGGLEKLRQAVPSDAELILFEKWIVEIIGV